MTNQHWAVAREKATNFFPLSADFFDLPLKFRPLLSFSPDVPLVLPSTSGLQRFIEVSTYFYLQRASLASLINEEVCGVYEDLAGYSEAVWRSDERGKDLFLVSRQRKEALLFQLRLPGFFLLEDEDRDNPFYLVRCAHEATFISLWNNDSDKDLLFREALMSGWTPFLRIFLQSLGLPSLDLVTLLPFKVFHPQTEDIEEVFPLSLLPLYLDEKETLRLFHYTQKEIFSFAAYGGNIRVVDYFRSLFSTPYITINPQFLSQGYAFHRRVEESYSILQRCLPLFEDFLLWAPHLLGNRDMLVYIVSSFYSKGRLTKKWQRHSRQVFFTLLGNLSAFSTLLDLPGTIENWEEFSLFLQREAGNYPLTMQLFREKKERV